MKILSVFLTILITKFALADSLYDCSAPRPEIPGFHNIVLFGIPGDALYVYRLPLFAGPLNGTEGFEKNDTSTDLSRFRGGTAPLRLRSQAQI